MIALSFPTVANRPRPPYSLSVAANSATGCASPEKQKAHKRHRIETWRFFSPAVSFYGGCVREGFGPAGTLLPRSCTPARSRHPSCASDDGGSSAKGAVPMQSIRTIRAAAHRRMAFAALHADSSLSTRLARYTHHITKARALEAVGGAQ